MKDVEGRKWRTLSEARAERAKEGLECPRCGCRHFEVYRTIPREDVIIRERICRHCGRKMRTSEVPE